MGSTSDVPILLLDVDGVLNAARVDLPAGWTRGTFNGYVLTWDPTVTARLRELHESGRVEIQWLTTWTTDADRGLAGGEPARARDRAGPVRRAHARTAGRDRGVAVTGADTPPRGGIRGRTPTWPPCPRTRAPSRRGPRGTNSRPPRT